MRFLILFLFILFSFTNPTYASGEKDLIHHNLTVRLNIEDGTLSAEDKITLQPDLRKDLSFIIHKGLDPQIVKWDNKDRSKPSLKKIGVISSHLEKFKIEIPLNTNSITISYGGQIMHALDPEEKEMARGFRMTKGIISKDGIYLSGESGWYPLFEDKLITFELTAHLPKGWKSVSQGERIIHKDYEQWREDNPQDEIFLIANRFEEYMMDYKDVKLMVFLRNPDEELAKRYLLATAKYIGIYERLIGKYPFKKFALVENFWETGLGMPSFTLLGPKIIRFPFIIDTSYPHEILHNWWGNSVYPNYSLGNWAEGLTAYLADHLFKEERGEDIEYRQTTLQKFVDYVKEERDYPLREFRMRHSPAEEAIGYGKSLMFFHMLRLKIGDGFFIDGLRNFYKKNIFGYASFDDLRKSFEEVSGIGLKEEFDQWIDRKGAPKLEIKEIKSEKIDKGFIISIKIAQIQNEEPFSIRIPLIIVTKDKVVEKTLPMNKREELYKIELENTPLSIHVDPYFDLMRRLHRDEIPPAISEVIGSKRVLIILPSKDEKRESLKRLSEILRHSITGSVEIINDNEIKDLPKDRSTIILGWENRFLKDFEKSSADYSLSFFQKDVAIDGKVIKKEGHSFVIVSRNTLNRDYAILFIDTEMPEQIGRKIPHYHKYSYLVFKNEGAINIHKGRWHIWNSPLSKNLSEEPIRPLDLKRKKLLDSLSMENMLNTIDILSGDHMEGRKPKTRGFKRATEYIIEQFREIGLDPQIDEKENVYGILKGRGDKYIVVGSHYDHIGKGYPGADDNASGVAVMLQLAYLLKNELYTSTDKNYIFIAFSEEEEGRKGSKFFVKNYSDINKCFAMVNLDTVGRLFGKKLLILGSYTSDDWQEISGRASKIEEVEIDLVKEPLDASDNISFEEIGIPAIQITSGPHPDYHKPTDTLEKIDRDGLLKILKFTKALLYELDKRESLQIRKDLGISYPDKGKKRKVSLGTIPDFTYKEMGYKIDDVLKNSPAEKGGLKKGDIIIEINNTPVNSIKDMAEILKMYNPGNKVRIRFIRGERKMDTEVELTERGN